jgi:hypothetical protein
LVVYSRASVLGANKITAKTKKAMAKTFFMGKKKGRTEVPPTERIVQENPV